MTSNPYEAPPTADQVAVISAAVYTPDGKMLLQYDLSKEDVGKYAAYLHGTLPAFRKVWLVGVAAVGFVTGGLTYSGGNLKASVCVVIGIAVAALLAWPYRWLSRRGYVRQMQRMFVEARGESISAQVEIDATSFMERTHLSETRWMWAAFQKIEETDSHAFLFVHRYQAIVIPRKKVVRGNFDAFVSQSREYLAAAHS